MAYKKLQILNKNILFNTNINSVNFNNLIIILKTI